MKQHVLRLLALLPVLKVVIETRRSQTPVRLPHLWQYISRSKVYWPVHHSSLISSPEKIVVGVDVSPGYMPGCYIQGAGGIVVGDYTQISCNVGLISRNHDIFDISKHVDMEFPSIEIGRYCWIGMNVTILPGVKIPDFCVIGAGSVVTKSVQKRGSVLVGNPARVIRVIEVEKVIEFKSDFEYVGFVPKSEFSSFRAKRLEL